MTAPIVLFADATSWGMTCRYCGEPGTVFVEWPLLRTSDSQTGAVVCDSEQCAAMAVEHAVRWAVEP